MDIVIDQINACKIESFLFPWQPYAEMVVNMAVVLNLETVSELLCEMELVFDHCNWSPVMVCCSTRCTPGYQGNLCDQRELATKEALPCILVSDYFLSLSFWMVTIIKFEQEKVHMYKNQA